MQTKLKYKVFGEFDEWEITELRDWFVDVIKNTPPTTKSIKVTIDWEPGSADV